MAAANKPTVEDGLGPLNPDLDFRIVRTGGMGTVNALRKLDVLVWGSEANTSEVNSSFDDAKLLGVDGQLAVVGTEKSREESVDNLAVAMEWCSSLPDEYVSPTEMILDGAGEFIMLGGVLLFIGSSLLLESEILVDGKRNKEYCLLSNVRSSCASETKSSD